MTSKIEVDFRSNTCPEVLVIVSCRFLKFLHHLCFWRQRIIWWHSYWAIMFGRPQNLQVTFWVKRFSRLPKHSFLNKKALNLWAVARTSQDGHTTNALLSTLLSGHLMSCHATSCHVTLCHVMPRHVASCYVMPRQVTSCYVMSRNFTSCHATSCPVLPRHVTHATSLNVTSCQVTWCHVRSCHVMLRYITSKVSGRSHDQRFIVNKLLPHAVNSN